MEKPAFCILLGFFAEHEDINQEWPPIFLSISDHTHGFFGSLSCVIKDGNESWKVGHEHTHAILVKFDE